MAWNDYVLFKENIMTRKFKNFWYCLTPRQEHVKFTNDVQLEIDDHEPDKHPKGAPHMHSHSYPDSAAAIAAAEDWIESAHRTVLDYYRGGHKG
jgi:hypothetical protein